MLGIDRGDGLGLLYVGHCRRRRIAGETRAMAGGPAIATLASAGTEPAEPPRAAITGVPAGRAAMIGRSIPVGATISTRAARPTHATAVAKSTLAANAASPPRATQADLAIRQGFVEIRGGRDRVTEADAGLYNRKSRADGDVGRQGIGGVGHQLVDPGRQVEGCVGDG